MNYQGNMTLWKEHKNFSVTHLKEMEIYESMIMKYCFEEALQAIREYR